MIGLISNTSGATSTLQVAIPIGVGLASAVYLATKMKYNRNVIPVASFRAGETTHDNEYNGDQDAFMKRCEAECGPVYRIKALNLDLTVISGSLIREVFLNDDFSAGDSIDDMTDMRKVFDSVIKSNKSDDNKKIHDIVRENITPNLVLFTPRIVEQFTANLDKSMKNHGTTDGDDSRTLVKEPLLVIQEMIAGAMASVFVGPEIAKDKDVIETFINATVDFGKALGSGVFRKVSLWRTFLSKATFSSHNPLNPLQKHVRVLIKAAEPVILERRRLEAEAIEKGIEYEQPDDVLQKLLNKTDRHGFVDIEDVCGHILILILASVHTTSDSSVNVLFYLAAFPQYMEQLYEESQQVLDLQQREREEERAELTCRNETIPPELDPSHDRELTAATVKKMVYVDSFVREAFRHRTELLTFAHRARKTITLSDGTVIVKGTDAIINIKSAHFGPEQGEDPAEFRPWRFVGKSKPASKVAHDFLPFGMGRHACPGRFLAIQEMKTVVLMFLQRYSKIEIQDPTRTNEVLHSRFGKPLPTGLYFTKRA